MSRDAFFTSAQMVPARRPLELIPQCDACGLFKTCRSPKMAVDGKGGLRILVVAEAPGKEEDATNRPLVGPTGKYLEDELDRVGIDMRKDCWLTNAVICRPPNNKIDQHPKTADYCRPNLLRTVRELEPEVILILGKTAVKSVMGYLWESDGGMERWAGWRIPSRQLNAWVCPTYHPAYLIREQDEVLDKQFRQHLKAMSKLSDRPWPTGVPDWEKEVEIIYDDEAAAGSIQGFRDEVAFDFETNMLKPDSEKSDIVCCSVSDGTTTIAFPWRGAAIGAMRERLIDPDVGKIAANAKFEHRWVKAHLGVRVRGWAWDTMLTAHALDSRRGITGLKFQAFVQLGMPVYDVFVASYLQSREPGGNAVNRVRDCDLRTLMQYCGLDSLLEFKLAQVQRREMGL